MSRKNIEISRLALDLRADGAETEAVGVLSACLNKWAGPRQRGIPQSYSPSHLLGEYYLNDVDRALAAEGFTHIRYLDDVRIFCTTAVDARRALRRLNHLVRSRGLNLQSAKTRILCARAGQQTFRQVHGALNKVATDMARELRILEEHGYATAEDVAKFTREMDPSAPDPDVLEPTWLQFETGDLGPFDKTIFHYLLKRLTDLGSHAAVRYVIQLLRDRPEETDACLRYLSCLLPLSVDVLDGVANTLTSADTIFEYQRWQLLRWFVTNGVRHDGVRTFARGNISTRSPFQLLRPLAILYRGSTAEFRHDYDRLRDALNEEPDKDIKACLLAALAFGPRQVYGSDLGRAVGESRFID